MPGDRESDDDAAELLKYRLQEREKTKRQKQFKVIHCSPETHHAVKAYAGSRGIKMPEAVAELIAAGLASCNAS